MTPPLPAQGQPVNLCSSSSVGHLLQRLDIRPSHAMGQHFLVNRHVLDRLIAAAGLTRKDRVLEIGAGLGVLSEAILTRAGHVTAIEKDEALYAYLRQRFEGEPRIDLIRDDALELDLAALTARCPKVLANLPYSVGSRLLVELACCSSPPGIMVLMLQRDVALRLQASPGGKQYGVLSILVQQRYAVERLRDVKPACFLPPPDVCSSIVRLRRDLQAVDPLDRSLFMQLVKKAFSERRKQIGTLFRRHPAWGGESMRDLFVETGIDPHVRPEEISVRQWVGLADLLAHRRRADAMARRASRSASR